VSRPGVKLVLGASYNEELQSEVPLAQHQGDGGLSAPLRVYERWPEVGEFRCQALEGARASRVVLIALMEKSLLCSGTDRDGLSLFTSCPELRSSRKLDFRWDRGLLSAKSFFTTALGP
jgi:hypothetical protein